MKPSRWIAIVVGVAAVVILFLVLRPGGQDETAPSSSPAPTPTESSSANETPSASATEVPTASPSDRAVRIDISVQAGEVTGPGEAEVTQGDLVRIVVRADVSDEVHVHGYDLHADVTPEEPGVVEFTVDAPGVFEVELEDAGLLLLELTVSP